jgi:hypothetical protein
VAVTKIALQKKRAKRFSRQKFSRKNLRQVGEMNQWVDLIL